MRENQEYPAIVKIYKQRYDRMATKEYIARLTDYSSYVLHDPIGGLDWAQLLEWEHRHLKYTKGDLPNPRAELPIDVIRQSVGRCGEFSLLYNGLLLADSYKTRLVVDCSTLKKKAHTTAGDHIWVEMIVGNKWMHIDPTERRINQPSMYALEWNKDINLVYALADDKIEDVTASYTKEK